MTQNGWFCPICNFSNLFPTEVAQNDSKWPILPNFQLLWPKHVIFGEISKIFIPWGGGHSSNFLIFSNFLSHFTPKRLKMAHDGKFCLKSCLLWWENIGKLQIRWNWPFRFILSHFGGKRIEKLEIRRNWPFQVILSHFGGNRLEKLWIGRNWPFQVILSHFSGKSCESGRIGHSRSFWDTSVGKIGKVANWVKLAIPSHSEPLQ